VRVLVWAGGTERAVPFTEGFAERPVWGETKAVFAFQEFGEREVVLAWDLDVLVIEIHGGRATRVCSDCHDVSKIEGICVYGRSLEIAENFFTDW
jgi:predicted ThiF/HesA family dinucleotide-utilizing enzyme